MPKKTYSRTPVNLRGPRKLVKKVNKISRQLTSVRKGVMRQSTSIGALGNLDQTGTRLSFVIMGTGDADNQREGNVVQVLGYECRVAISLVATMPVTTPKRIFYRCIHGLDRQPNGAQPVIGELLNTSAISDRFIATRNFNGKKRYSIYSDKTWGFTPVANSQQVIGATSFEGPNKLVKFNKKFKTPVTVKYFNTNAITIADISTNNIFMYETVSTDGTVRTESITTVYYMA